MDKAQLLQRIIELLSILLALLPILVQIFSLLTQKTHNQKIVNLRERAEIIVTALEQTGWTNEEKQSSAYNKLSRYSNEVGIKATPDQLLDYIESSVRLLKEVSK